jgi:hypothetical protein
MNRVLSRMMLIAACLLVMPTFGDTEKASAQSSLKKCPKSQNVKYHNCFGTYSDSDGNKYVGEFKDDKFNGKGTHTFSNGEKYVGEFKDDKRNGRGTYTYPDGEKYVGEFKDGKPHGQVTWTRATGVYVGQFKDGQATGLATWTTPSGDKYVGEFKDGKYSGQGVYYNSDGSIAEQGIYENDVLVKSVEVSTSVASSGTSSHGIAMVLDGGTYSVPVTINDLLPLNFVLDSGASDVSIPADVVLTLIRTGTLKESDFIGSQTYRLADGSTIESKQFTIRSMTVGGRRVTDVTGSVADVEGSLLLGQSFLQKFKSWSIDNNQHRLFLE